jgi:hypothetical protein
MMADDYFTKAGTTPQAYMKKHGHKPVSLKAVMGLLNPLMDAIVSVEKSDENSLVSHGSLVRLEDQSQAVRDYCSSLAYTHTAPEITSTKELPSWLK